jgi:ketosteroid isomerase-like protein
MLSKDSALKTNSPKKPLILCNLDASSTIQSLAVMATIKTKPDVMKPLRFVALFVLLIPVGSVSAQPKDSLEVAAATQSFLTAFSNFDWKNFRSAFAEDATVFFPTGDYAKRVSGIHDIEATWTEIFPEFLDPKNTFRLDLNPQSLSIKTHGGTAIATFHLGEEEESLYRRTIVFIREKKTWKIAHLHASGVKQKK